MNFSKSFILNTLNDNVCFWMSNQTERNLYNKMYKKMLERNIFDRFYNSPEKEFEPSEVVSDDYTRFCRFVYEGEPEYSKCVEAHNNNNDVLDEYSNIMSWNLGNEEPNVFLIKTFKL